MYLSNKVKKNAEYWLVKVRELQLRKNGKNEKPQYRPKKKKRVRVKKKYEPVKFKKVVKKKKKRSYKEYLKSNTWKLKRDKVIKRANGWCEICKINRAWQVHHKTYKRKYRERLCDLIATCEACHKAEHDLLTDEEVEMAVLELSKSEGYK